MSRFVHGDKLFNLKLLKQSEIGLESFLVVKMGWEQA